MVILSLFVAVEGYPISPSPSIFEHSYHAQMSDSYLSIERMQYFYEQKFFTHKCPLPMPYEYLSIPSADILAKAYATQEKAYLDN